ncbi:hypothetical protein HYW20_09100 [Candidatus Woesearchaeota archaeon]|nr:hypothetical protein [Candidatus Woesearchaeota archaeon]
MKAQKNNVLGAVFAMFMLMASTIGQVALFAIPLAALAPAVLADNGVGEVTFFDIDNSGLPGVDITKGVQTVNTQKEHSFKIHNNDSGAIDCIDEIIITYPNTWQDVISMAEVSVTNMGAVLLSNEADDGSLTNLVTNNKSIRIVPDKSIDGVELCPSGTTEITIGGNIKSPINPEDSTIKIYTSDQQGIHNEPTSGQARQLISLLPFVHVTKAEELKIQYLDFTSIATGVDGADVRITASARGAMAKLTELYIKGTVGTTIDVYMDDGSGVLDGPDRKIASAHGVGTSTTTVSLNNYAGFNVASTGVEEGFVKDVEQGGSDVKFFIGNLGGGVLTIEGHADEDGNQAIDDTYAGTGFTNPPKAGTVLHVEVPARQRLILAQLVRKDPTNSSRLLDVTGSLADDIPIYFTTTLSSFSAGYVSPRNTDTSGQVEISLEPGTTAGNALVEVCFPDPDCKLEDVAIAPGVANHCNITKGLNTEVQAGDIVTIEATVYDQYGNPISNNPSPPTVAFDITSAPGPDADLDDDTNPPFTGDGDGFESEQSNLGIANVSLQTSATVGDNVVHVTANGMDCGTTTVKGVLGQAGQTNCEVLGVVGDTIDSDDCFDVLVTVSDENGNPLPVWESLVEFSLADTTKTIQSTTFREELFITPYKVQGKLNPNDPAQALVTVCGCDALGTLNIECKTDTLNDGNDTLNVINSKPTCIDVQVEDKRNPCDNEMQLHSSILDTCGNKVVDQNCGAGSPASSCILLESTCGELSTEKTCIDLFNTGQAPLVDFDISNCACGDITVTATDTGDCCDSVYAGQLPQCGGPLVVNKQGPATKIDMSVYPKADNQDNFWVSEKAVLELQLKDACNQVVTCEEELVNVTLTGEDCVNTSIQVDSPLVLPDGFCREKQEPFGALECARHQTEEECEDPQIEGCGWIPDQTCPFYNETVHKVVIQNCADGSKEQGNKEWTDLPEKDDIVVDKIAFSYDGPTVNVEACIYEETELEAGFQATGPNADLLWKCADLNNVPTVPSSDSDTSENTAGDELHDGDGIPKNGVGDVYIMELDDRISKFNGRNEYDNQRLGGAIVEPGDTKDFYIVLSSGNGAPCGTYDADYLYFEDYNSPDITGFLFGGHVIDTLEDSENYTRRNDDYETPDPYPVTGSTPDYGFGDTILHDLLFAGGRAFVFFRDLVAETVNIHVDAGLPVNFIGFAPAVADNQAEVTFKTQPATQVVARNHGDLLGDSFICDDAGFEPSIEYDPDGEKDGCAAGGDGDGDGDCDHKNPVRDCRPAKACDGEGYDVNLQVTDGFQNQVGLATEVQLDACLTFPHFLYLGDTLLPNLNKNITIDLWDILDLHDKSSEPRDACFSMAKFKEGVLRAIDEKIGPDDDFVDEHPGPDKEFLAGFVGSEEFDQFVSSIFDDKDVKFLHTDGTPIVTVDSIGHLIITTGSDGKARFRIESDDSSQFQIKSFDTSFRIFMTPHALDADYFDVAFAPGSPDQWDVIAVPSTGVPADGEQEAKLLIRKLDACGNPIHVDEEIKVTAFSDSGRAVISRDFSHANNYDDDVVGNMSQWSCKFLFPWFDDCHLEVLDDVIEDVTIVVEDAQCEGTQEGLCVPSSNCDPFQCDTICRERLDQQSCEPLNDELCDWVPEATCQKSDAAVIKFVGAPVKLAITEIKHSDLLPADGWREWEPGKDRYGLDFEKLPPDACGAEEETQCGLFNNKDICFKECVQYGNNGGWVTVEVQDKFGQRVTGYLGDGFKKDPGDVAGKPDNIFENICVALDDPNALISDATFGWIGLSLEDKSPRGRIYCGDLAYGRGSFKVVYKMLSERLTGDGFKKKQPLDPRETEKVIVSVFDVCDRDKYEDYGDWKEDRWDDECNAQEYNENNLPDSETASRLDPDSNKMIFVSPADRWDITSDRIVVAADGQDYATLEINTENAYMDVRTSLDATVQSSLLGSKLESEAITPGCYVDGIFDPLNPTSINVMTEDCSGGRAKLKLSSTEPGIARVTVTGNNFGCVQFEVSDEDGDELYTVPECEKFGVIPMTPKVIEIEFKQSFQNKIVLKEGWNFFSVPVDLDVANNNWNELGLGTACSSSASWNEGTQSFQFSLGISNPIVEPLEGYWCKCTLACANNDVTINVVPESTATVFLPPTKVIVPKWNDVGLSTYVEMRFEHALISIDQVYTQVLDWVESLQRYAVFANTGELGGGAVPGTTGTGDMEAGQGYFIWSTDNDELAGQS